MQFLIIDKILSASPDLSIFFRLKTYLHLNVCLKLSTPRIAVIQARCARHTLPKPMVYRQFLHPLVTN